MKTKKLLSLVLSVIMIMSVIPMYASAADPIALTASNITTNPTAEGTIYYGQTVEETILLTGGEVQYDGIVVPGSFVHTDPSFRPLGAGADRATRTSFTFVPLDSTTYSSIAVRNSRDVTYVVLPTTPVLADENDKPIVTEQVEAGTTLSNIAISGGKVQNPYYPEETTYLSQTWTWVDPTINVDESGYYEAKIAGDNKKYSDFVYSIYIEVLGSITVPEIVAPTIELLYNSTRIWADINLDSCKAFVSNEDGSKTKIEGSFSVADAWKDKGAILGSHQINVIFTPADVETYAVVEFKLNVNINPIPISFGSDFKGASIDDPFEYEANPGTLMRDVLNGVKKYLNYPPQSVFVIEDANYAAQNGRTYKLTVIHDNPNYVGSEVYITVDFKDVEFAVNSVSYFDSTEKINVTFNSNKPNGTFDIYLDGKLIGDDVKLANDHIDVPYKLATSGKHTVKVVYNPTENDYYFMADYETEIRANVKRSILMENKSQKISVNGKDTIIDSAYILNGDEISIKYGFEDLFVSWVITDASGKAVALDGVDITSSEITFTMPDHDLVIAVKTTLDEEAPDDGTGDGTDDDANNGIFGGIWSFFQKLINWFISIIKQMMSLFAPKA